MEILQFKPSHYEAMADVYMASYRGYTFDPDNLRYRDGLLQSGYLAKRWTAIIKGKCVGFGEYNQTPEMKNPYTFLLNIAVHPDHQEHGIGTCLYNQILDAVMMHQPVTLRAVCRANSCQSSEFLQHRGFAIGMSIIELNLDLDAICRNMNQSDPVLEPGIVIHTMMDLNADPNRDRNLYELVTGIRSDISGTQEAAALPFEQFLAAFITTPSRLQEATFIACNTRSGEYIGISDLFDDGKNGLFAGVTGVRREYRRRGIATALKQRGFLYASDRGYNNITTFNAAENAAIAAVNTRFGFIEKFTWLHYEKQVSTR